MILRTKTVNSQQLAKFFISALVTISAASQAAEFNTPPPNDGRLLASKSQTERPNISDEARLRTLKELAAGAVGWTVSHIGPIRSVKMEQLREAFSKTTKDDIPLLIYLLSDKTLSESAHQTVKYLIAMHGQAASDEIDRTAAALPALKADYADIREYMKSQPWQQGEK